jgi:hypothetical protein
MMSNDRTSGLYLFKKTSGPQVVLRELLQFIRTLGPGQNMSFSYIEANTSLHPNLSLWENLQIETGTASWVEFTNTLNPECFALVHLLRDPTKKCSEAQTWERLLVSLVKGLKSPSRHMLIDMNEEILSPLLIQNFKKNLLITLESKNVILATANASLWMDCAHSIVEREEYKFSINELSSSELKKYRVA